MTHDSAFQRALQLSLEKEINYVVYRSEMNDYGAMPLDLYEGYSSDILAEFSMGIRVDNNR